MNVPRWLLRIFWFEDRILSRLSGGRWTLPNASGGTVRTLFLQTVGRKSGRSRRNGLYYLEDGPNLVVVASNAGRDAEPSWWLNLRAHPDTSVEVGKAVRRVHARQASPDDAARLYAKYVEALPQYGDYQKRTTRDIAVVILEPRSG